LKRNRFTYLVSLFLSLFNYSNYCAVRNILIIVFILLGLVVSAQNGTIRGTVFDDKIGETLVGVNVLVKGTSTGATTDLDGKFSINIAPGKYTLLVSFISYQTLTIENVEVKSGDVTLFNNLRMKESTTQLTEVVITAKAVRTNETALMTMKKKSAKIVDGISAERMKMTGDGTAVEAAKRVTGVSVEGGKYVYVRGLGDRYSKTTLNQMDVPGLDPDRNSIQLDIFPTNLINNMMISKNFTADLPADFTGGLMNIETKDFPEEKTMSLSFSGSYNPMMHFNTNYLDYKGGSTDLLGFDDGTRALPTGASSDNIPTPVSGASSEEVNDFVKSFNPTLNSIRQMSLMDFGVSFSMGNQISLSKTEEGKNSAPKLGYIFSASYKFSQNFYDDVEYGEFQRYIDPDVYDMRYATLQTGEMGEQNILVGLLGGIAYKTTNSKVRLTAMRLQNGESRAGIFNIINDGAAVGQSGYTAYSHNLEYNERSMTNVLLNGTHIFDKKKWEIDWRISPTLSTSDDPDIRKTAFSFKPNGEPNFNSGEGGNPSRIWRSLSEINLSSRLDITRNYEFADEKAKLMFGAGYLYKNRDYEILFFDIQFFGSQPTWTSADPIQVLVDDNLYPDGSIYYNSGNNDPNPNEYTSNVNNISLYVSNEMNLTKNLKTIIGLRMENYVQRHTGRDQAYASGDVNGRNLDNDKVLESLDLFPTANFIYSLTKDQNLRFSYTRTIARPSFKELSFAQIIDPITNRIFNGSLFTYGDWDGQLVETRIDNIDLRWELFLKRGQIFSVSAFYKRFDNPIELVRIPEQQTSSEYQPRNVGNGQLYGFEMEFRKDLDFISASLTNFNLSANFTWVYSEIDMTDTELQT
jgi:outer membrane receptor protein involved in Fe transport